MAIESKKALTSNSRAGTNFIPIIANFLVEVQYSRIFPYFFLLF